MTARCFCFAGSDVLQWIVQRLWISNLGESSSDTHLSRTTLCAAPQKSLWRVEAKWRLSLCL